DAINNKGVADGLDTSNVNLGYARTAIVTENSNMMVSTKRMAVLMVLLGSCHVAIAGRHWDVVPRSSLGIVPDLHQLACRRIDEALGGFLPWTLWTDSRMVPASFEEERGDHHGPVYEQVHDQAGDDARDREQDGADDRQHAVRQDRLAQHSIRS